jgi:hypothetical protein
VDFADLRYTYSSGTAPTTSVRRLIDTATLSYTAKRTGSTMRFHYSADVPTFTQNGGVPVGAVVLALFRDSVANAIDWQRVSGIENFTINALSPGPMHLDHWFEVASPDTSAHIYTMAITMVSGSFVTEVASLTRRTFEIEESPDVRKSG